MSTASSASKPSSGWQPPSLEEMQAMLPQYRFEKLLGRGGMGAVYKAVQASLDRPVAIKVLPVDLVEDDDAQFAERFKNEARTMARLSHPGIVDVFDFGETKAGLLYIVMEFIEGTDIAQMIQSQGKLPEDYALSITAHVCDALAYAHQNGIVHRDIKPANILINMEGAIKVADFGLAKANDPGQSGITKTNMAMGTPDFVAPEAFIPGVPLDGRADLYAIGVMLYQMLTGEIPRGIWTLPGMKLGTDPRFDAIISKAMQTDREVRYQTATDIRRDLDTILALPRSALIAQQQAAAEAAARATQAQRQAASSPQKHASQQPVRHAPLPVKKSNSSLIIGITVTAVIIASVAYMLQPTAREAGPDADAPAPPVSNAPAAATTPRASLPATGWQSLPSDAVQADGWGKLTKATFAPGNPPDIALRARLRFVPNSAGISAQSTNAAGSYRAEITPKGDAVMLHRDSPVAAERKALARAALSAPLTPGQEYVLAVASVGDTVSVHVDGRPLLSERLPKLPGSVVLWTRSPVDVRDIEWLAFPGSSTSSPPVPTPAVAPAMTSPVAATPAVPLDPAQRFSGLSLPKDLTKKGNRSSWEFSGEQLVLSDTTFQDLQLLALPQKPGDSYELEMEYAFRADNSGYLKLFLPAPGGWCSLQLHSGQIVCFSDNNRQPHAVKPGGEASRLRVKSERSGTAARFTVTLDGKPVTEFTGTGVTEWKYWPGMSPLQGSICLGGETKGGPPITLQSFRLVSNNGTPSTMAAATTLDGGTLTPVRDNPAPSMSAPPADRTATAPAATVRDDFRRKSVSLIPLVDVKRDVVGDPTTGANVWKGKSSALTFTDADKAGRIAAPVSLKDARAYEIELLWKRRPMNIPGALTSDSGYIALDVPVGADRWVRVDVAWAGDKVIVGGERVGFTGPGTQGGEGMRVVVRCQDDKLSVKINGNDVGSVNGLAGRATADLGAHSIFKSELLPAVYCARGDHEIVEWTVRALDGDVRLLWEPSLLQDARIAQLETGFQARFDSDAQKPFLAALASLNQSYIANGIARDRAAAKAKGSLAEVTALDAEKAAIEKGAGVPAEDAADTPAALKALRGTYRTALVKITTERDAKAAPLLALYLKALDAHVSELTKAGKIDEAKKVQVLRDEKAAKKSTAAPVQAQAAALPAPTPSADAPLAAATFLVNNGGSCIAVKEGVRINVKTAADIPALPFDVVEMNFDTYQGASKIVKSSDFQALNGLRSLRRVTVRAPECKLLKDDAYAFLAGNEELDFINLEGVPAVTDGVLKHLSGAKKLTTLGVQYAPGFTGEELASMPFLPGLIHADFLGSGINDKGVEVLAAYAQLQKLRITHGSATDTAFAKLGSLPKLVDLRVDHTGFGDKAAAAIASRGILQYLNASFTEIGNSGLGKLEALTSLTELVISQTKVSDAAVARLQKALPNCKVTR